MTTRKTECNYGSLVDCDIFKEMKTNMRAKPLLLWPRSLTKIEKYETGLLQNGMRRYEPLKKKC